MTKKTGQDVGYIRVSSVDQNLDRQLADVELDEVFEEKASAKDTKRPVLQQCLKHCRKGDTLHVHSIDRLARNLGDLESLITQLNGKGVTVRFHKEELGFTGEDDKYAKLMLQLLGAVSQFERALIRERQREGIAARKAKGLQVGAKPKLTPEQAQELRQRASQPGANKKALAEEFGISRYTLYQYLKEGVGAAQ